MHVKSIAECSLWSILQYFRPSLNYHLSFRSLFCLFLSGRLRQVLLYLNPKQRHIKLQHYDRVHANNKVPYLLAKTDGSSLVKQSICVNTQLKSSKKQLKLNVCVPKSNSAVWYFMRFHCVPFRSIWVINECQWSIDFFTSEPTVLF